MARTLIKHQVATLLDHVAHLAGAAVRRGAVGKASSHEEDHDPIAAVDGADFAALERDLLPELRKIAQDGARLGLEQVDQAIDKLLRQANARAIAWAHEHAGELIKGIKETTLERVRDLVKKAETEGWSNETLASEVEDDEVFSGARAEMVARTETAAADVTGNLIGWEESGVVEQKEWIVADANECDFCREMQGVRVGLDEDFDFDGEMVDGPPGHPNCRCDVLPVLAED